MGRAGYQRSFMTEQHLYSCRFLENSSYLSEFAVQSLFKPKSQKNNEKPLQRHWRRCSSMQDLHRGEIAISSRLSTVAVV
jgi:hypothetical protein